jgi:hypothetical protein
MNTLSNLANAVGFFLSIVWTPLDRGNNQIARQFRCMQTTSIRDAWRLATGIFPIDWRFLLFAIFCFCCSLATFTAAFFLSFYLCPSVCICG